MTVIVLRDAGRRFHGFLASCMLEIAPGVFTAPRMNRGVRERVWAVLADWYSSMGAGGIVMTFVDRSSPVGQSLRVLGSPPREIVEHEGFLLARWTPRA